MKKLNNFFILLFCLICAEPVMAITLSGLITDEKNEPLPFVSVYIPGTTNGTTSNIEGRYFLELNPGNYTIACKMMGYGLVSKTIQIVTGQKAELNFQLKAESFNLKEVVINSDDEDPAYAIIRKAQKKRSFYRDQIEKYSCDAYVKSTQRLTQAPKTFFGQKIDLGDVVDSATKMFYLSESVSHLFYTKPETYREEMISSKVSGSPQTYSFNQAQDVLLNLYDNLIYLGNLTPRGVISPISANALFSYKYRLEGSYMENGILINKISVIPKRLSDPVFSGTIYICDETWRIHSADLFITRAQQMEFVDTFRVKETFIPVNSEIWVPFNHQFSYSFNVMGFKGDGIVLGIFNNYSLQPEITTAFVKGELVKVNSDANKKDSLYWTTVRPVPLTSAEQTDYHRRDSTRIVHESKAYLDSVDRVDNKFSVGDIFTGYTRTDSYHHRTYRIGSPIEQINFNTVEGWNGVMKLKYTKEYGEADRRIFTLEPIIRYGVSNKHWNGHVEMSYRYNTKRLSVLTADAGTDVVQFNNTKPISELVNTMYSLIGRKNYMKVFEKRYLSLSHVSEIVNGLGFGIFAEYSERETLKNTTDYSVFKAAGREYSSNIPVTPVTQVVDFPVHHALIIEARARIRFGQTFINRPEGKYIVGTKYPTIRLAYKKGIQSVGDVDFDFFKTSLEDDMRLGLIGKLSYVISYSQFLSSRRLFFPDYIHFNGNKTFLSDFRLSEFKNLDYYAYSTSRWALEAHAEHNFGGFFLNKIPLIRKLKLQEIAGVHFMQTKTLNQYLEFSLGVEKLGAFRADIFTSFTGKQRGTIGFMLGIKKSFGLN